MVVCSWGRAGTRGMVCSPGGSALGGSGTGGVVWSLVGLVLGGSAPGEGGVSSPRGVPGLGGVWSRGCLVQGVPSPGGLPGLGGCIPACTEADTLPSPVDRILDTRL